jgi:DNA polymerase-1
VNTVAAQPNTVYLIDAHALIYQSFHAVGQMNAPDGRPTNAVFGFLRDVLYLQVECRPTHLLCVFDVAEQTFRNEIYPQYKAQRPAPPDDLVTQIPLITQALTALRVPVVGLAGYEADDVIATLAVQAAQRDSDVFICTTDKDCRQLLSERIRLLNLRKRQVLDVAWLKAEWGITPEQVVDFQALVGDSVDNVPGVPGVGEKTAAKLLNQFQTLDGLLAHIDEVKPARIRDAIVAAQHSGHLQLARQLVQLRRDVPIQMDWDAWRAQPADLSLTLPLFAELGLRRFAEQVKMLARTGSGLPNFAPANGKSSAGGVFASTQPREQLPRDQEIEFEFGANASQPEAVWEKSYTLIDTNEAFAGFMVQLAKCKRLAIDLETTGLDPHSASLVGVAICWQPGEAYYLPVRGPLGAAVLDCAMVLERLKPILENPEIAKVNQNIKYDMLVLRQYGINVRGVGGDPMLADYLLRAGERNHNLDMLASRYLNYTTIPIEALIGKRGKNQLTLDQVETARVCEYACEDADVAWRLNELLAPKVREAGLGELYEKLEVPLIEVLTEMEATGVRLDTHSLQQFGEQLAEQLHALEEEIYQLAGRPFQIASLKQLRAVLFEELKLPTQKRTGLTNQASTDQETLEKLASLGHALPRKLIEHRQIAKLKSTYVDALPGLVNPRTGRVHTSFNQTVTATGRLSSSDPNLQNIPTRTELGKEIRRAFIPRDGWHLLTADYSQIELRLLAHFCGDDKLREAFAANRDVHTAVAAQVFGVPETEVTSQQRRVAKTVNFGVIYGISPHGLAVRLGITRSEAAKFIDDYFARYPRVEAYQQNLLARCRANGYVSTILGRRRRFAPSAIRPLSTYRDRNAAEREAINMEIQGSAADLMKQAMLRVHQRLVREARQSRIILSVHDELVLEVPPDELDAVQWLVREEMSAAMQLDVPLVVDVAHGPNWLDVQEAA